MADKFCLKMSDFHVTFRDLLNALNMWHGTNGFTSFAKEDVLRMFSPWKMRRLWPGLNPCVPKTSTLPLDHRSRFIFDLGFSHFKFNRTTWSLRRLQSWTFWKLTHHPYYTPHPSYSQFCHPNNIWRVIKFMNIVRIAELLPPLRHLTFEPHFSWGLCLGIFLFNKHLTHVLRMKTETTKKSSFYFQCRQAGRRATISLCLSHFPVHIRRCKGRRWSKTVSEFADSSDIISSLWPRPLFCQY